MDCPRCKSPLDTIHYEGVEIETCPGCHGEWLDKGELKRIVQTVEETFPPDEMEALDAINKSIFTIDDTTPNLLGCPRCGGDVELSRFNYASSSGVALDRCPECGGIWLDKDELEHVQILVEEWNKKLGEDQARFGPMLEKERQELDARIGDGASGVVADKISRVGFINAILRRVFQVFDA